MCIGEIILNIDFFDVVGISSCFKKGNPVHQLNSVEYLPKNKIYLINARIFFFAKLHCDLSSKNAKNTQLSTSNFPGCH